MFIAFTAPLALLCLDMLSVGLCWALYRQIQNTKRKGAATGPSFGRLLLLTGTCQVGFVALLMVAELNVRLTMRQNEIALHSLLLSAFVFPPLLLWWKHRQFSPHH
jgi:hypothetical protein